MNTYFFLYIHTNQHETFSFLGWLMVKNYFDYYQIITFRDEIHLYKMSRIKILV